MTDDFGPTTNPIVKLTGDGISQLVGMPKEFGPGVYREWVC